MTLPDATRYHIVRRYAKGDLIKHIAFDFSVTPEAISKIVNRLGLRRHKGTPRMPTPPSLIPLERISLNLYKEDVAKLKRKYGYGWTGKVRELVQKHVKEQEHA